MFCRQRESQLQANCACNKGHSVRPGPLRRMLVSHLSFQLRLWTWALMPQSTMSSWIGRGRNSYRACTRETLLTDEQFISHSELKAFAKLCTACCKQWNDRKQKRITWRRWWDCRIGTLSRCSWTWKSSLFLTMPKHILSGVYKWYPLSPIWKSLNQCNVPKVLASLKYIFSCLNHFHYLV